MTPLSMAEALERLGRELGPHSSELRLVRVPPTSEADIERLAAVVAPHALTDELVTLLARGGLTPWDHWPGIDSILDHPLQGYPEGTPCMALGDQDPDMFQVVLPPAPAEISTVTVFSTNALFVTALFPSLRTYFAAFCEAFRLWKDSPAAADPDDGPTIFTGSWWEVVATDDPYEPIEGLREVLDALIRAEDPTWPPSPMGLCEPGQVVPPEWAARLRLQNARTI